MRRWIREHRRLVIAAGALAAAGVAFVLVWFQPHKLVIDERVDETLPGAAATPSTTTTTLRLPCRRGRP